MPTTDKTMGETELLHRIDPTVKQCHVCKNWIPVEVKDHIQAGSMESDKITMHCSHCDKNIILILPKPDPSQLGIMFQDPFQNTMKLKMQRLDMATATEIQRAARRPIG